ncbi:hypothetical protein IH979_03635, partial [Patescibacteria group bacterium]|nr:hypothetical protein [Patescibacteria group bacterium]
GVFAIFLLPLAFTVGTIDSLIMDQQLAQLGVTDLLFSFVLAGIASVIFHALFGKHYHKLPKIKIKGRGKEGPLAQFWLLRIFLAFLFFVWGIVLLALLFDLKLPESVLLTSAIFVVYMVSHRQDLLGDALWSAALSALVVFLVASVASIFAATNFGITPIYSDASIGNVPVDLLIWSAALGLAFGPLYEYIRRLELK